jgi:hypothetical protein
MAHSISIVNGFNSAKRLISKLFGIEIGILMRILNLKQTDAVFFEKQTILKQYFA